MGSGAGRRLRACMIDGFGYFDEADYRRSWLFFDEVDYVLPGRLAGPIAMPPLEDRQDFVVARPALGGAVLDGLLAATRRDATDETLRELVVDRVPAKERDYASVLVWSDEEVRDALRDAETRDPAFATLFLANKLLWFAAEHGTVPIVGRPHATEILGRKAARLETRVGAGLLSLRGGASFTAFAAGLALDFVDDEVLAKIPIARLVDFKSAHRALLERHQLHLVEVAQKFSALADGGDFTNRLAELRVEARNERARLEDHARKAWTETGLELAKKAVIAASASLFSGLAVLRGHSLHDVLVAALPAAVAALGVGTSAAVEAATKSRSAAPPTMAYLFRAAEAFAR